MSSIEMVLLTTAGDEVAGRIIEGMLKDAGIACFVHTHGTLEVFPMNSGEQAATEIYVFPKDLESARQVLQSGQEISPEELERQAEEADDNLPENLKKQL